MIVAPAVGRRAGDHTPDASGDYEAGASVLVAREVRAVYRGAVDGPALAGGSTDGVDLGVDHPVVLLRALPPLLRLQHAGSEPVVAGNNERIILIHDRGAYLGVGVLRPSHRGERERHEILIP